LSSSLSRLVESLRKPALPQKGVFKLSELLIQEVIGLVDETNDCVRGSLRRGALDIGPISQIVRPQCRCAVRDHLSLILNRVVSGLEIPASRESFGERKFPLRLGLLRIALSGPIHLNCIFVGLSASKLD
jgi:hypothetical protein